MAVQRNIPTCPFCGKKIAKAIYRKHLPWESPFYEDDFIEWKYIKHNCKERKKFIKDNKKDNEFKDLLLNIFKNEKTNKSSNI